MRRHTTGYTIASTLILLAKHPQFLAKLRSDTEGVHPSQWSKSSPFFNHILKESFRFIPVAALGSVRQVGKDYDAGNSEIIPKGATVFLSQVIAGHKKSVFGDNADSFNPDRWYNANDAMKRSVNPFSLGQRNCVGQTLAMTELEQILPYIISRFDIQLIEEGHPHSFFTWKFADSKLLLKERPNTQ